MLFRSYVCRFASYHDEKFSKVELRKGQWDHLIRIHTFGKFDDISWSDILYLLAMSNIFKHLDLFHVFIFCALFMIYYFLPIYLRFFLSKLYKYFDLWYDFLFWYHFNLELHHSQTFILCKQNILKILLKDTLLFFIRYSSVGFHYSLFQ